MFLDISTENRSWSLRLLMFSAFVAIASTKLFYSGLSGIWSNRTWWISSVINKNVDELNLFKPDAFQLKLSWTSLTIQWKSNRLINYCCFESPSDITWIESQKQGSNEFSVPIIYIFRGILISFPLGIENI